VRKNRPDNKGCKNNPIFIDTGGEKDNTRETNSKERKETRVSPNKRNNQNKTPLTSAHAPKLTTKNKM